MLMFKNVGIITGNPKSTERVSYEILETQNERLFICTIMSFGQASFLIPRDSNCCHLYSTVAA